MFLQIEGSRRDLLAQKVEISTPSDDHSIVGEIVGRESEGAHDERGIDAASLDQSAFRSSVALARIQRDLLRLFEKDWKRTSQI